jgi:hypothetical protein
MTPLPLSDLGRFLSSKSSIQPPPPPVIQFDPINLKLPTRTPSIQLPPRPVFKFDPKDFITNFKLNPPPIRNIPLLPSRDTSPLPASDEKAAFVFLLTFGWICTAFAISTIARNTSSAKKHETSISLIGATAVTILTYANAPMGVSSMVIIMLIGLYVTPSDPPPRLPMNWQQNIQPLNFPPIIFEPEDVINRMRAQYGPFHQPHSPRAAGGSFLPSI